MQAILKYKFHLASASLIFFVAFLIPTHMDEYVMFHRLACVELSQQIPGFRESCQDYGIKFLNFEFHRSYSYIGTASSIAASPFFFVLKNLWVNFVIGIIYLLGIALGLKKAFNLKNSLVLVVFLSFPLLYSFIHDGGPIRISALVITWTPVLIRKYLDKKNRNRYVWLLALISSWVIAMEDKPFFVYLIPGAVFITLASILTIEDLKYLKLNLIRLAVAIGLSASCALALLASLQVEGGTYLGYLISNSPSPNFRPLLSLGSENSFLIALKDLDFFSKISFLLAWPYFSHRTMQLRNLNIGEISLPYPGTESAAQVTASLFYLIGVFGVLTIYKMIFSRFRILGDLSFNLRNWLLIISAGAFWLSAFVAGGWAVHHFIFAYLPILILTMLIFDDKQIEKYKYLLTLMSILSVATVYLAPKSNWVSSEIDKVYKVAVKNSDKNSIISCSSWGCYYQYSLLNRSNIPVVFVTPEVPEHFAKLENLAILTNKTIYVICRDCSLEVLNSRFPNIGVELLETDTQIWFLFRVYGSKVSQIQD